MLYGPLNSILWPNTTQNVAMALNPSKNVRDIADGLLLGRSRRCYIFWDGSKHSRVGDDLPIHPATIATTYSPTTNDNITTDNINFHEDGSLEDALGSCTYSLDGSKTMRCYYYNSDVIYCCSDVVLVGGSVHSPIINDVAVSPDLMP